MQDGILHRNLELVPLAGLTFLIERAQHRDRQQHAGARIAERDAGAGRGPIGIARHAEGTAAGLRDHVKGQVLFERAAFAETLHLRVDDTWIDLLNLFITEAEPFDRPRREVLDHHIGFPEQIPDQFETLRRFQICRHGSLIGVQDMEIERIVVQMVRLQAATRIATIRVLDLHHICPHPG